MTFQVGRYDGCGLSEGVVGCLDATGFRARQERPGEYAQLVREGRLEALLADPPPLWMRNFARVVGFSALTIGFFLIFMIGLSLIR